LYAIDCFRKLLNIELVEGLGHMPTSSDEAYIVKPYLVECAGKLLMVRRCRWRGVIDLGGHALFVSSSSSKSFPAGEGSGVQENCIYFMNEFSGLKLFADPLHDSGVYNMKKGVINPLLSETAVVPSNHVGPWRPTWLFPTQAM